MINRSFKSFLAATRVRFRAMINTRVHAQRRGGTREAHTMRRERGSPRNNRTHNVAMRCNYCARGGPRIMYLEQEVEKIRRFVVINNLRLLAKQLASLRPQWRATVTPFYRGSYTGCLRELSIMKVKQ